MNHSPHPRALLSALYHAAVQGAAPFPRTGDSVHAWFTARPALSADAPVYVIALGKAAPAMLAGALASLAQPHRTGQGPFLLPILRSPKTTRW